MQCQAVLDRVLMGVSCDNATLSYVQVDTVQVRLLLLLLLLSFTQPFLPPTHFHTEIDTAFTHVGFKHTTNVLCDKCERCFLLVLSEP